MTIKIGTDEEKELILAKYPYTSAVMHQGGSLVIAYEEKEIIGFLWSFSREIPVPIGKTEDFINVIEIFNARHRRKGIGSLMVQKCIDLAREKGSYQVRAYCEADNKSSHMLWIKNGFSVSPVKLENQQIIGSYVAYVL